MVEAVCDTDEELMMKYLEGEEISIDELKTAIRKGVCTNKIFPVLCGSAYKNKGIQMLLDAVVDYMPSPLDIPAVKGTNPDTDEEETRAVDDKAPLSALAFKIMADPFVGKMAFFRVYSGTLQAGTYVYNSTKGKKERVGRILRMHANHREEVQEAYTGDIGGIVGLKIRRQAIRSAMKRIRSSSKRWNSPIRLFPLLLNRRRKLTRKNGHCPGSSG